jgi:hypothetical protein
LVIRGIPGQPESLPQRRSDRQIEGRTTNPPTDGKSSNYDSRVRSSPEEFLAVVTMELGLGLVFALKGFLTRHPAISSDDKAVFVRKY